MKLLMVCDYPTSASEIDGGTAAAAFNLIQALLKYTDIEIAAFGFQPGGGEPPPVSRYGRLTVVRCNRPGRLGHALGFHRQRRAFRDLVRAESPDVVHAQGEGPYASFAVDSGRPNVYTIHGVRLNELRMQRERLGPLRYHFRSRMIREHHRKARNIVAINEYTRKAVEGLHRARTWTIPNAVDEHFFDLYAGDSPITGNVLLVGGVRRRKDIVTCLSAVNQVLKSGTPIHLDIVGPTEADYASEVVRQIEDDGLGEHVTLHGLVSEEQLDTLYRRADVVALSSVEESSPISIVQGMAAGKPVVATNVGGISEMVEEGANSFLVDARDGMALGDRLRTLIEDRALRGRFSERSHALAVRDWSAKAVALKTYEMYKEVQNAN